MKENEDVEKSDDPRDQTIGNTEPAESSAFDGGGSEKKGDRAEAPDGAASEKYPGPTEESTDD